MVLYRRHTHIELKSYFFSNHFTCTMLIAKNCLPSSNHKGPYCMLYSFGDTLIKLSDSSKHQLPPIQKHTKTDLSDCVPGKL